MAFFKSYTYFNVTLKCISYLDETNPENCKPDVTQHGPFFSVCQALFYIFVFRHKSLLEMAGGMYNAVKS